MDNLHLIIGSKNDSSWSLRPWVWLKHHRIPFAETEIALGTPETGSNIRRFGAGSTVPILISGQTPVWESLAILEFLAEQYPQSGGWPEDPVARAFARSVCAEMHGGFHSLRSTMPQDCTGRVPDFKPDASTEIEISRIKGLWDSCRQNFAQDGPWLFGTYSIADAMYAPVVLRFNTYRIPVSGAAGDYIKTVLQQTAVKEWLEGCRNNKSG